MNSNAANSTHGGSHTSPTAGAPFTRDLTAGNDDQPPARMELRRLVQYHWRLSKLCSTYTCAERALHARVAILLNDCDPRTWSDGLWREQSATVIRARLIVHIADTIDSLDAGDDAFAYLDSARTIVATTGVVPAVHPTEVVAS
ncbi:hypothetical protein GOEFS_051_00180 [Gordonia effusa NBRC 100432]|uniref:Uncharacterized protein n=1 Tax=Gordonia effusa NBRC 100432 TaxID=1077974 RepID=H0QZS2_9ACTN|nr:hypothetical protein [Gordonia effusa]GAB18323.1 hypothetical protein GOEFS_051_00180 [Gordonia effusa NBRC 100432]